MLDAVAHFDYAWLPSDHPLFIIMTLAKLFPALFLALLAGACTTMPSPSTNDVPNRTQEYRFQHLKKEQGNDSLLVALSFSGGGTRAAALSHGVLEELATIRMTHDGQQHSLLEEIDIISAVSGGSITAAHYALTHEKHFAEFPQQFLYQDLESIMMDRLVAYGILSVFNMEASGRIDILVERLNHHLLHGATYADLTRIGLRPYIVLNATDMSSGARFPFTQAQFDLICADLNEMSLARAVAASAAVPLVFSPVTLKNKASQCTRPLHATLENEPDWLTARQKRRLEELRSYRDETRRPYIHLLDGGLSDNMAIWDSLDNALLPGSVGGIVREMGRKQLKKALFIVVSAETDPSLEADRSADAPSLFRIAQAFADIPINHNSRESLLLFRETLQRWKRELNEMGEGDIDFYLLEISLRGLQDKKERARFMKIPTTLSLPREDVDSLRQLGRRLLRESPDMQRFMRDTDAEFMQSDMPPGAH